MANPDYVVEGLYVELRSALVRLAGDCARLGPCISRPMPAYDPGNPGGTAPARYDQPGHRLNFQEQELVSSVERASALFTRIRALQ